MIGCDYSIDSGAWWHIYDLLHSFLEVNILRVVVLSIEDPDVVDHSAHHLELEDTIQKIATCSLFANENSVHIDIIALQGGLDGHRRVSRDNCRHGRLCSHRDSDHRRRLAD